MKNQNEKLKNLPSLIVVFGFSFFVFNSAAAQALPTPLSLSALPASPAPGQEFIVTASTPTFDKDTAYFEWVVDGKARPESSGLGQNQMTLEAGRDIGSPIRFSVHVSRAGGETTDASLAVIPSELSLPWIAETSAPKWYRGKALPGAGATIAVGAVPQIVLNGTTLDPKSLIYRWSIDNTRNALVGAGKRVFRFRASDFPRTSHQIDVVVEDIDRRIRKERRVLIETAVPRVLLYPSTPLGGIEFRTANFQASTRRGLFDVRAEPFFFPDALTPSLTYAWTADGGDIAPSQGDQKLLTFDTNRRGPGSVPVGVTVRSTNPFLSSVSAPFTLFLQ